MSLYDVYEKRLFPYLLELGMRRMGELRPEALAAATGGPLRGALTMAVFGAATIPAEMRASHE